MQEKIFNDYIDISEFDYDEDKLFKKIGNLLVKGEINRIITIAPSTEYEENSHDYHIIYMAEKRIKW